MIASVCPTSCDDDCDILCHEDHAVFWKRDHDPALCETHARLFGLLADANAEVDARETVARRAFSSDGAIEDLRRARAYRNGIARCIEELGHVER